MRINHVRERLGQIAAHAPLEFGTHGAVGFRQALFPRDTLLCGAKARQTPVVENIGRDLEGRRIPAERLPGLDDLVGPEG